eukprot:gnl/MRDRNA2_/MRDRNA2_91520_c0_seq1.p1 gnl/MRDRNA2_/MRDRNA2_91520_c0~~gnl/MRDRNA2_/MRDRNA2_91520_c0_seq1.p1  ORF type:complete len:317 (+),score=76.92 gnl/MRDRNA2_/MRDRNA2_91520_c0_seq1:58-1008(+)
MGALCCAAGGPNQKLDVLDAKRVDSLISHVQDTKLKTELSSPEYTQKCKDIFAELDANKNGFLDGEELTAAVKKLVDEDFQRRVKMEDISDLAKHFDVNKDGKISPDEFATFSKWCTVMLSLGFMGGASPFAKVKKVERFNHLLIVSEGLDKSKILSGKENENVQLVYFHPDSLTLEELVGQLDTLASKLKRAFKSVALALPGPNDQGSWPVCVNGSIEKPAGEELQTIVMMLADPLGKMVQGGGRLVFLLAKFGADDAGRKHLGLIEDQVTVDCAAEKDDDGNVMFVPKDSKEQDVTNVYIQPGLTTFKKLREAP